VYDVGLEDTSISVHRAGNLANRTVNYVNQRRARGTVDEKKGNWMSILSPLVSGIGFRFLYIVITRVFVKEGKRDK